MKDSRTNQQRSFLSQSLRPASLHTAALAVPSRISLTGVIQATISGQLSQSCHNPLSGGEETRLSPEGAENQGGRDIASLQMWYKLDEKCLPPVYRFLPISSPHPDLLTLDPEQRRRSREGWGATCCTLRGILQRSTVGALGQEEASLLLRTVLDWEVETGVQSVDGAPPHPGPEE
ncbi:NACHT domain- and WD repeat-containing protein 1 [Dissostichus eleginoides]|uniref:NACHT domain- and WD repeat-containing protein 1 n=1 Tax=Dissostichus eleginoides TaxID=100907 RepID=A0AAD9BVE9_DISEL|nr:NACHT domain- and WD repeat-containing protein 1 [Dissostichus eleginoides]